ncbi:MFS transporter, ACS family, tartrate transporter [Humidesulfovibrio mexicanus]|uniref:MFS transporter, ACS family, tartrate transporter n=1 Tax=Humidesulfovibrio mexicanus TaxID=147047 RepID=A0A239B5U7_9BACT|nr:MFS transporter [Humidesulfovibrio mexicanus]SNS02971.1 MFS transporter, ACS family, tartrate transporter [Humidesulfovibrio mexicanus]
MTPSHTCLRRKIDLRLLPYLFVLYVVAYLDRVNVSFAAHGLTETLGFTSSVFGLGAGMFFAGYVLFEVPSNLILRRVGARLWIARIMVTWGLAACCMALVHAAWSFHLLRFLLGVAEAGFLPGVIYYLTLWYPPAHRARAVALFMAATPVAGMVGAPLSGWLLGLHGAWGLEGWRWMFVLEGVPAVLLGFSVLWLLPNGPGDARWLSPSEREALAAELAQAPEQERGRLGAVLRGLALDSRVWLLSAAYFALCVGMYGLVMWMPTLIAEILGPGAQPVRVGLLSAIPYLGGVVGMILVGRRSDRTGERRWHTAGPLLASALGFALSLLPVGHWLGADHAPWWSLCCFTLATMGLWGMLGPFWTIPTGFLSGAASAGGVALINSIGNAGGFVGPTLVGVVRDATGSHHMGFLFIAGVMALGGCAILWVTRGR